MTGTPRAARLARGLALAATVVVVGVGLLLSGRATAGPGAAMPAAAVATAGVATAAVSAPAAVIAPATQGRATSGAGDAALSPSGLAAGTALPSLDPVDVTWKAVLVIGLLLVTLRVLRRGAPRTPGHRARLAVLETKSVGPKSQVFVLAAGSRRLLVGLTPGGMTTLADLDATEYDVPAADATVVRDANAVLDASPARAGTPGTAAPAESPTFLGALAAGAASLLPAGPARALAGHTRHTGGSRR